MLGAVSAALNGTVARIGTAAPKTTDVIQEPIRETPVVNDVDVLVCGGGSAGAAAAIAAARAGANTLLIEAGGCLGGILTSGLINNIIDGGNKAGIMKEIMDGLERRDARYSNKVDPEILKLMLEEMCGDAGVNLRYHTWCADTVVDGGDTIRAVITESKAGREAWRAKVVIDATGDGDVSVSAGCGYDLGHPDTGQVQPMSFNAHIVNVGGVNLPPYAIKDYAERVGWLREQIEKSGHSPSYANPTFYQYRDNQTVLMSNHQYGILSTDPDGITQATLAGRAEMHRIVDGLRSLGGRWKDVRLVDTAERIGTREGRRIHGLYTVDRDDIIKGARFDDGICRVTFNVDVHSLDPKKDKGLSNYGIRTKPYDIPLRSLIAKDIKGLMMAGRCISGDFYAHASYRVAGNTFVMGEAAGKTAAYAAQKGMHPHQVAWSEVENAH